MALVFVAAGVMEVVVARDQLQPASVLRLGRPVGRWLLCWREEADIARVR